MLTEAVRSLVGLGKNAARRAQGRLASIGGKKTAAKGLENFHSNMLSLSDVLDKVSDGPDGIYSGSLAAGCIGEADMICAHRFNILGRGHMYLGDKISWNTDHNSGYVWKNEYFKCIRTVDLMNAADVKVPWELSRFHHLITLGKAWYLTRDKKYSNEFTEQLTDWIKNNPAGFSVNWTSVMEAAIRSVNWIAGSLFFRGAFANDPGFLSTFNMSLYEHGAFIERHCRYQCGNRNNHYVAHFAGLIWLGLYFANAGSRAGSAARRWLGKGLNGFERQMRSQVFEEGSHKELSTYYHKFVTEVFLLTALICRRNGVKLSDRFTGRLEKMCGLILKLVKPDGFCPLIGDSDDGRFLVFSSYFHRTPRDFRHVLAPAAGYFGREDLLRAAAPMIEDVFWTSDKFPHDPEDSTAAVSAPSAAADAFCGFGLYLFRDHDLYVLIRCGRFADRGLTGHVHNDQLSFVMSACGFDFFVDPGTYVYSADRGMRELFRSTRSHNTLFIEGAEQNESVRDELFLIKEKTFSRCLKFSQERFSGAHTGYRREYGLIHRRSVDFSRSGVTIRDVLSGDSLKPFRADLGFMLDPQVEVAGTPSGFILKNGKVRLHMRIRPRHPVRQMEGVVSESYGTLRKTTRIVIEDIRPNEPVITHIGVLRY